MTIDTNLLTNVGAIYGAVQLLAQALMAVLPSKTVAWRICKFIVSGAARPVAPAAGSDAG